VQTASKAAAPAARNGTLLRRWAWLLVIAAGTAGAIALALLLLHPRDPERVQLVAAVREAADKASPDSAALLVESGGLVDHLLHHFPGSGAAWDVAATLYHGLGKTKDAVRCWQRAMDLDPALAASACAAIAAVAYQEGQFDEAVRNYRSAMQFDRDSTTYPVRAAEALNDQGKHEEAVELLEPLLTTRPKLMTASVLLGQAYLGLKQYEKARQHLETGVRMGPEFTNGYFALATACARLGDQEKSQEYLARFKELKALDEQRHRQALQTSTDSGQVRNLAARTSTAVGKAYLANGEYRMAESCLRRGGELGPTDPEPRTVLAWLYEQQERTDEALQMLAELCDRAPDDLGAQMSAGAAYARLGRNAEAERALRRAIELTPQSGGGYAALANLFLRTRQKLDEAGSLAETAAELEPVAEHHFLLCLVRRMRGDIAGAVSAIDAALELAPRHEGYRQLRRELSRATPAACDGRPTEGQ
jgi:tetratricopeptide (TPR) repeat protein